LLGRWIGVETEYAPHLAAITPAASADDSAPPPLTRGEVFEALRAALSLQLPVVPSRRSNTQWFLANGGAISIESAYDQLDRPGGLIEGASPECAGPHQCLAYQRAQERLLQHASARCRLPARLRLLKNSCDDAGHFYGSQENYAAVIATGFRLWLWRAGLLIALCGHAVYLLLSCLLLFLSSLPIILCRALQAGWQRRSLAVALRRPIPQPVLTVLGGCLRIMHWPLACLFLVLSERLAFRQQRQGLTAFLVSRTIWAGGGHLDERGRFSVAIKSQAINCVMGLGHYWNDRPIFTLGHWLRGELSEGVLCPSSIGRLLSRRQRLQISIADSNMSDTAEYLRLATTSLVLDMIEAGAGSDLPRLSRPLDALHRWSRDWVAVSRAPTSHGPMTALQVQWSYLRACQSFVATQSAVPDEVHEVLRMWQGVLEGVRAATHHPSDLEGVLGRVDWLTKRWLIDELGTGASLAARRKVDVRYHELDEEGYAARLRKALPELQLVSRAEIDVAARLAPSETSAGRRGLLIREFATIDQSVHADWHTVEITDVDGVQRTVVL
jgi:proteasome accessory factor A